MAGPALSLHARSQALHQTTARLAPTVKTVQIGANWSNFVGTLENFSGSTQNLTTSQLARTTQEIKASLAAMPLPLGAGAWYGLTANPVEVTSGAAPSAVLDGQPPKLEVLYRNSLTSDASLMAGSYAAGAEPAGTLAVAVTPQTAARFGLHPGSRVTVVSSTGTITLAVTAIVRQRQAGSTFWAQDPLASQPSLTVTSKPYWAGGVFADPGQLGAMQTAFTGPGLEMNWEFPLALGSLNADQAQGLANALNRATTVTLGLTGPLEPAADNLNVTSPLIPDLALFLGTQAGIETVLLLLSVSLIVIAAAVILLAARMLVARRGEELAMLRARGGSLRQVTALMLRGALVAAVPAAAAGAGIAVAVIPGDAAAAGLGWLLAGITVAVALAGPALIAAWEYRKPAPAANAARILTAETGPRRRAWRRPVAEVTACAACVAGLVVLRGQGVPAGGQVNLLLMLAPVLVAVPVVLIMLRLYPLAVRGLLRLSARGTGATGFVALSAAARSSLTGVLPAFALVLALSLATFAGMVTAGIARGETAAAWHTTGADAAIQPGPTAGPVTPGELKSIAAVRGVTHATAVWNTTWVTPFGQAGDGGRGGSGQLRGGDRDHPVPAPGAGQAERRGPGPGRRRPPCRCSPRRPRPRVLGHGADAAGLADPGGPVLGAGRGHPEQHPGPARRRHVRGHAAADPARPGRAARAQPGPGQRLGDRRQPAVRPGQPDHPGQHDHLPLGRARLPDQLPAAARRRAHRRVHPGRGGRARPADRDPGPGARVGGARADPGPAHRDGPRTRHQPGHGRGDARGAAAVVAGAVCAVVLPHLIGSSIDLSAFTGAGAPVLFQPDVTALGLPAAGAVVLAVAALAAEARTLRRRGIAGILRAN